MKSSAVSLPLSESAISQSLDTIHLGRTIYVVDETESTNSLAQHLAHEGTPHGTVVLAERQTKGKGRLGRLWHSPSSKNIYCSLILQTLPPPSRVHWIPLVTGIGLGNFLHSLLQPGLSLKWPNDLLIGDRKIGGILCESTPIKSGTRAVIVGFGLNVDMQSTDIPDDLQDKATSLLMETGQSHDRNQLTKGILYHLEKQFMGLVQDPISKIRDSYRSWCSTIGQKIRVHLSSGQEVEGYAVDITNEGSLKMSQEKYSSSRIPPKSAYMEIREGDVTHLRAF
jgi:BirA family biotin operon repressor/biotin-[acetyl-CoA-carboxylase] ligase